MTVVVVDVLTKALAERYLDTPLDVAFGARLALGHNSGAAFGALAGAPAGVVLLLGAACIGVGAVAVHRRWLALGRVALGLLAGGALANLGDRLGDGRVTDFLDLGWWPAFNLADVAITFGVLAALLAAKRPA